MDITINFSPIYLTEDECLGLVEKVVDEEKFMVGDESNISGKFMKAAFFVDYEFVKSHMPNFSSGRNYSGVILKEQKKLEGFQREIQKITEKIKLNIISNYLEIRDREIYSMGSDV